MHPKNVHPRLPICTTICPISFVQNCAFVHRWVKVKHFHNNTLIITRSIWRNIKKIKKLHQTKWPIAKTIELWDTLEQYGLQIGMSLRVYNIYTYMPQNIYMTPCKFNKLSHYVCACLHLHVEH
jgi:hypothetical protein